MATIWRRTNLKFEDIIDDVLKREGGEKITKDPSDPGGTTKYGISQRAFPDLDIEALNEQQAKLIYFEKYWVKSRAEKMPNQLKEIYFDMCVNFGIRGAGKVLQEACNGKNKYKIKVDGIVGAATLSACKNLELERLRSYRVLKFSKIVLKKDEDGWSYSSKEKYWYGWFRRALEV